MVSTCLQRKRGGDRDTGGLLQVRERDDDGVCGSDGADPHLNSQSSVAGHRARHGGSRRRRVAVATLSSGPFLTDADLRRR